MPRAQHIHGLRFNHADGSLIIATHAGMFRAPRATVDRGGQLRERVTVDRYMLGAACGRTLELGLRRRGRRGAVVCFVLAGGPRHDGLHESEP